MEDIKEQHLAEIQRQHAELLDAKYRRGAEQHKQFLPDLSLLYLLEEALMENIDQYVYLVSAINKVKRAQDEILLGVIDAD